MIVKMISPLTGELNEMDLPITEEQLNRYRNREAHIQVIFPDLSPDQREFLISGATPEDWAKMFPPEDEEDDDIPEPCAKCGRDLGPLDHILCAICDDPTISFNKTVEDIDLDYWDETHYGGDPIDEF